MSEEHGKKTIVGAIFPILREHILNLFERHRDVFVKFTKLTLKGGSIIVFYVSGQKVLIGEAKAHRVQRSTPHLAWSQYSERIFLDKEEYNMYAKVSPISKEKRRMKEITILELKNIRKYKNPVRSIYPVTPSGRYLTKKMIDEIRDHSIL